MNFMLKKIQPVLTKGDLKTSWFRVDCQQKYHTYTVKNTNINSKYNLIPINKIHFKFIEKKTVIS